MDHVQCTRRKVYSSHTDQVFPQDPHISVRSLKMLPLTEEKTSTEIVMWFMSCQLFKPIQYSLINSSGSKLINKFVIVNSIFVHRNNFKRIDNLLPPLNVTVLRLFRGIDGRFAI